MSLLIGKRVTFGFNDGVYDDKKQEYVSEGIVVGINKAFTLLVLTRLGKLCTVSYDECTVDMST